MTIAEINRLDKPQFTQALAGVYESSPWIPETTFAQVPFTDLASLQTALQKVVDDASHQQQLDLINAHPDLGGKLGVKTDLTKESRQEQSRLGLDSLDADQYQEFSQLNQRYRNQFGFPFIICVGKVSHRDDILAAFRRRLELSEAEEFAEALEQIHQIAQLRLAALFSTTD